MNGNHQISSELNWAQLATLIEASNLLNTTLDHDEVLRQLISLVAEGVEADRATLYLLDEAQRELHTIVLLDEVLHDIRLPLEQGIAGYVARTGETVNVADAYDDPRFDPSIDQKAGYRTRTMLTVPMFDSQGQISGVLQSLNKRRGLFLEEDKLYLQALAEQASLALEKVRQYKNMATECQHLSFLYHINALMTDQTRLREVLLTVIQGTAEELGAEASSILLWDSQRHRLVFVAIADKKGQTLLEIEVPPEDSIAGWVLQNEKALIVDDVQNDPRFFSKADERTGFVTRTLVCAPMKVQGQVIGVLEVLNKQQGFSFSQADLRLVQTVANYTALAIESTHHYESLLRVREYHERRAQTDSLDPLAPLG